MLAYPITQFDISLLNGVDYYWKIVEDHLIRGDGLLSGPLALLTPSSTITSMHICMYSDHENDEQTLEKFGQWNPLEPFLH